MSMGWDIEHVSFGTAHPLAMVDEDNFSSVIYTYATMFLVASTTIYQKKVGHLSKYRDIHYKDVYTIKVVMKIMFLLI